ncbi:hypothetical protein FACS189414_2910 [Bacteroidia bacterium]|nr:hypothetical protein AGMMS49574_06240 [Bacteroidia bacterium]GHU54822.1 hypothetical protein FACS189411_02160 [Bacteroidia bacterium]GHU76679.1 hypothetical protein FACS189414_2910 [Bacteroidia bacterium]
MDNKVKLTFRIQFIDKDLLPNGTNWFDSQIEVDEDQIVLVVKSKLDTILSSLMTLSLQI